MGQLCHTTGLVCAHICGLQSTCILEWIDGEFPPVGEFFAVKVGDGTLFRYWLNDWLAKGSYKKSFPALLPLYKTHGPL